MIGEFRLLEATGELIAILSDNECAHQTLIRCTGKTEEAIDATVVGGYQGRELRLQHRRGPEKVAMGLWSVGQNHPHTTVVGVDTSTLTKAAEWFQGKRELTL